MTSASPRIAGLVALLSLTAACSNGPLAPTRPDAEPQCTSPDPCDCCTGDQVCFQGLCCTPACTGKQCGSNGCGGSCGTCDEANFACNETTGQCECTREDDKTVCESQGKTCGAFAATDRCGNARALDCGTCDPGFRCNASNLCEVCVPDDVPTLCANNGAACGPFTGVDNCGEARQVECGGCSPGFLCNATTNQCDPCESETEAQYCARVGGPTPLDCGTINATDNCNVARTINCGTCVAPRFCDATNHCHDCIPETNAAFCASQGRQCGPASGTDSCNNDRTVTDCGSCASHERCDDGTCLLCVGETDVYLCAFYFKDCGTPTVVDTCGVTRAPNCGPATCLGGLTCTDGVCSDGVHPTNDSCTSPLRLLFDPSGVATAIGDLTAAVGDYAGSCGAIGLTGNDLVYAFTLAQTLEVQVAVHATSISMMPVAYIRDSCTNTNDLICGSSPSVGADTTVTARALPPGTYYLIIDSYAGNSGSFSLTVTTTPPRPPPGNDNCSAPEALVFSNGVATVTGDTLSATDDYDDLCGFTTFDGPDIVYRLTLTTASAVVATIRRDANSAGFWPALELLSTCPSSGSALACSLQTHPTISTVSPNLAPGDYYLIVDGSSHSYGGFQLEVKLLPPVTNDLCTGAMPVTLSPVSGTTDLQATLSGDTSLATDNDTSSCNLVSTGNDLVYSFEIPAATYYAITIEAAPTVGSHLCPSLTVKTGCGSTDPEQGCVLNRYELPATLNYDRLGPGTYYVFVDGWGYDTNGPFDLTITASVAPPPPTNDVCARPNVVALDPATGSATITESTATATDDYAGGCAMPWDTHTGRDLVYAVTMPANGGLSAKVVADTSVSPGYLPVVYIQSVCGDRTTDQACGNYNWSGYASATANSLTAGSTYYIVVDGKDASSGSFTLSVLTYGTLTNDGCSTAKAMVFNAGGDFSDRGDMCSVNSDAMAAAGQTCTGSSGYGKDLVYKLVTTQPQNLRVSYVSGQTGTSQIYLRTECATPGSQIVCNEVNSGAANTLIAKQLPAGEYYLWLDNGWLSDCGVFTMTAHLSSPPAPPSNDLCTTAEVIAIDATTGIGTVSGRSTESSGDELNGACANSSGGDVVYSFTLSSPMTVDIAVTPRPGSDLKPIVYLRTGCAQVGSELNCAAVNATGTAATLQFAHLAANTYYLVVDSYDVNATGLFDITVTTTTPPPLASNDLCGSATAMPAFDAVTLTTSITGNTLAGSDDDKSGCATGATHLNGPDLVYSFQLAAAAKVTATVTRDATNATYKPAVAIRRGCALEQEVACKADSQSPPTGSASVTTALSPGTWYVVVDGLDGSYGPFTLVVAQARWATIAAGDSCGNSLPLALTGTTATASGDLQQSGLTDDYVGLTCANWYSSPDMVYTLTLTCDSFVSVGMAAGATGGAMIEPGSYMRRVCDDPSTEIACAATWLNGGNVTYSTTRLAAGTYFVFADSISPWSTGTFDLAVAVTPATGAPPSNDACPQPMPIAFTNGAASVTGDTSGAFDDYGGSSTCGSFTGRLTGGDLVYSFTAPAGATFAAVVAAGPAAIGYSPALYVRDSCASGLPVSQLACATGSAGGSAGLLVTNLAASTYYVVVDGQSGSGGDFTLDLFLQTTPVSNSSCTAARPLSFTATSPDVSVAQVVGDTSLGSSSTEGISQGSQYCYSTGSELFYSFSTTGVKDLTVDLTPLGATYQPAVYLRSSCTDPQSQVACNLGYSGPLQLRKLRLPAGNYTLVADSQNSANNGPFTMKVTLADPPLPPAWDTCSGARSVILPASGMPALVVSDGTLPANDDYVGGCANSINPMDGGDVVYTFSVGVNTLVTAKVTPHRNSPWYRAAVYIRTTCTSVSDDVCAYPSWGSGPSSPAMAKASLPPGAYFLVVDGVGGTAGDFDLELSRDDTLYVAGDHCIDAQSLDGTFVTDTLHGEMVATFTGTTVGASNDADGACDTYSGEDIVYSFTVTRSSVVTLTLGPLSGSSFNGYFYLRTSCADPSTQVYCRTPSAGTSVSGIMFNVAPGTYYLFVDSVYSWTGTGAFEGSVSIRATPAAPRNDVCRDATTLNFVAMSGSQQVATLTAEDSTFATHDSSGNCFWAGGNDLVYTFTTSSAHAFDATVTPDSSSGWMRPSIYLRSSTCASSVSTAEVSCGVASGNGQAVTVRTNRLPAGTYFLFVDSAATPGDPPGGRFDLTARLDTVLGTVPTNDNCSGAQQVALTGPAPSVTTLTAQTTAGATDDTSNTCGQAGPDVVYYFDLTAAAQVKAKVTAGAGYNPAIALRSTCASGQILCASSSLSSVAEVTAQYLPAGRYFAWVDSGNAASSGSFDLELTLSTPVVTTPPASDLCGPSLATLTKGVAVTGTTVGAFDNYFNLSMACSGMSASGPDVVYAYVPTTDGAFSVTLISDSADLCVWMSEGICGDAASCVAYNNWGSGFGGTDSFSYAGRAGVSYYIVVDSSWGTNAGTFALTVN